MESKLYAEFRWEAEHGGRLPVIVPCEDGVYMRAYRAASWSSIFADDEDERINTTIGCVIYTHQELEGYEYEADEAPEA